MEIKFWWPTLFVAAIILTCFLIFPSELRVADLLGKDGKYDEAIENYEDILQTQPSRMELRIELSRLYLLNEEPEKAVTEIEKVGVKSVTDPILLNQIADVYSGLGDSVKTVRVLQRLVALNPTPTHKLRLADAYVWNARPDSAEPLYEELLKSRPGNRELLNKLAQVHFSQKDFNGSLPYLDRLIELSPNDSDVLSQRAEARIEVGERQAAATDYEKVLQLDPQQAEIRRRLAELYVWVGQPEHGMQHYDYLVRRHPNNALYFDRFMALAYDFDPGLAMWHFLIRLQKEPENHKLRERFVDLCLHIGDTEQAVHQMQVLIAQHPDDLQYRKLLAYLYQDLREPHLANRVFEDLFDRGMDDSEVIDELVGYYHDQKRYHKLANFYSELQQRGYRDSAILDDRADLLVRLGKYDAAINQYEDLLKRQPESPEDRMVLAELYLIRGKKQQAVAVLKDGIKTHGIRDASFLASAGQYFVEQELVDESISAYERLVEVAPKNLQYKRTLVQQYIKAQEFDAAVQLCENMLTQFPNDLDVKLQFAHLRWLQHDFDGMNEVLDEIEQAPAANGTGHRRLSRFYFEHSYFDKAILHLQSELQTAPQDSATLRMLGLSYAWNSQPERAKAVLQRYHQLYPADYYTHYQLGEIFLAEEKSRRAGEEFRIALSLLDTDDFEQQIVRAQIHSHLGNKDVVTDIFEPLLRKHDDIELRLDYAECLVNLEEHTKAQDWLQQVLETEPQNHRALRLRSRSYYKQGRYAEAARTLEQLRNVYPNDLWTNLDLADSQLHAGDWYSSTQNLERVIETYPHHGAAQERLMRLRRTHSERIAAEFETAQQSDNLFQRIYNVVLSKAQSSLLHIKAWLGQEVYSTEDGSLPDAEFTHLGVAVTSSYNAKLQTIFGAKAQQADDTWHLAVNAEGEWKFNPTNTLKLSADLNDLWNDPFTAAFLQGRVHRLRSELSLSPSNRLYFWNQLSYERHMLDDRRFGEAVRGNVLGGYRLLFHPEVSAFYNLYFLKYRYRMSGGENLVAIPEEDAVHYVGGAISQQLSRRFFYEMSASLGYNSVREDMTIYGTAGLEFYLDNRIRLRSAFEYGSQSQLTNQDRNASLRFDLSYFY